MQSFYPHILCILRLLNLATVIGIEVVFQKTGETRMTGTRNQTVIVSGENVDIQAGVVYNKQTRNEKRGR